MLIYKNYMKKCVKFSENNNIKLIPHLIEFKQVGLDKILWYSTEELKKRKKENIEKLFELLNLESNNNI